MAPISKQRWFDIKFWINVSVNNITQTAVLIMKLKLLADSTISSKSAPPILVNPQWLTKTYKLKACQNQESG